MKEMYRWILKFVLFQTACKASLCSHLSLFLEADAMKGETGLKTFVLLGEFGLDSVVRAAHNRQWADSPKPPLPLFLTCLARTGCPLDTVTGACAQICGCNQTLFYRWC